MGDMYTGEQLLARAVELADGYDPEAINEAQQIFETLLNIDRNNRGLVFFLALTYEKQRRYGIAEQLLQRALQMAQADNTDFAEAHNNLGIVMMAENRVDEARERFARSMDLDPTNAAYIANVSTAYVNMGTPHKAIEWCERALAIDPDNADAQWNRALALLELGLWEQGFKGYRSGLKFEKAEQRRMTRKYHPDKTPLWNGTAGQTVVVYGEQGVGDEILASSMLPDMAHVCNVIYDCHPRLVEIMRHSFGERFPVYGTRKQDHIDWPQFHEIDAAIPVMQLGEFFRKTDANFPRLPYLTRFEHHTKEFAERLAALGPKPKIGISWKGGSMQQVNWNVAGTNANGINTANVKISLSTDGGMTYPIDLGTTPNDGTQTVKVPNIAIANARMKIQGAGNIFFDISDKNFAITRDPTQPEMVVTQTGGSTKVSEGKLPNTSPTNREYVAQFVPNSNSITIPVATPIAKLTPKI